MRDCLDYTRCNTRVAATTTTADCYRLLDTSPASLAAIHRTFTTTVTPQRICYRWVRAWTQLYTPPCHHNAYYRTLLLTVPHAVFTRAARFIPLPHLLRRPTTHTVYWFWHSRRGFTKPVRDTCVAYHLRLPRFCRLPPTQVAYPLHYLHSCTLPYAHLPPPAHSRHRTNAPHLHARCDFACAYRTYV